MTALALLAGAALLAWPAFLNGYPLVFIDTVSYLEHTILGALPWDKAPGYGPALHAFHWRTTLWLPLAAQALLLSFILHLTQRATLPTTTPARHLLLCAAMAALTSLPWFTATLMPDILAGVTALALTLLAFTPHRLSRAERIALTILATLAIAAHLSHLVIAAALTALALLLNPRQLLRPLLPTLLAPLLVIAINYADSGIARLSPNGAVFLLARLQADGPAIATLRAECPRAGWYLCAALDRLPMDSDDFLWSPTSPVSQNPDGTPRPMGSVALAPEARAVLDATFLTHRLATLQSFAKNTLTQLTHNAVGDTLPNTYLAESARRMIRDGFPPAELARFDAGRQMQGTLPPIAAPFLLPHLPTLIAAIPLALLTLLRGTPLQRTLILAAATALLANAFATGALSGPHDRYGARLIWLLPLAAALGGIGGLEAKQDWGLRPQTPAGDRVDPRTPPSVGSDEVRWDFDDEGAGLGRGASQAQRRNGSTPPPSPSRRASPPETHFTQPGTN